MPWLSTDTGFRQGFVNSFRQPSLHILQSLFRPCVIAFKLRNTSPDTKLSEPDGIQCFRHFGYVTNIRKLNETIGFTIPISFIRYENILQHATYFEPLPKIKSRELCRKICKVKSYVPFEFGTKFFTNSMLMVPLSIATEQLILPCRPQHTVSTMT
jgi:hypothetical protein